MVCNRCIMVVRQQLEKEGVTPVHISLGEVETQKELSSAQLESLGKRLEEVGFEILDNQHQQLVEKIKNLLIAKVQSGAVEEHFSLYVFLNKSFHQEYTQLSRLFSEVEGTTIEQFFILQKIEKVKEWLAYNHLTLSEIAWKLGYSSVAHISAQFKKVTGLTPSFFKKHGPKNRQSLDKI